MRRHAVMGHRAPRMVLGRRLREPNVTGIAGELAAFERPCDGIAIADLAARGVHQIGTALHLADHRLVEEVFRLRVEGRVDRHDVANGHHFRRRLMESNAELLLDLVRKPVPVGVVQLDIERFEPAQHRGADPPSAHRADVHALDVIGSRNAVGDVPATFTTHWYEGI